MSVSDRATVLQELTCKACRKIKQQIAGEMATQPAFSLSFPGCSLHLLYVAGMVGAGMEISIEFTRLSKQHQ